MLTFLSKQSADQIGLDLTERELRALTLCTSQTPSKVVDTTTIQLAEIDDEENALTVALYLLRKKIPSHIKKMVIGIPCDKVMMQHFEVDACLCDDEIHQYLLLQADRLSKHVDGEILVDFIVTANDKNGKNTVDSIIVAKNYVVDLEKQCKQAGFKVIAVDVSALALQRITQKNQPVVFIDHDAILLGSRKESLLNSTHDDRAHHIAAAINRLLQMHHSSDNHIDKLLLSGTVELNEREKQEITNLCQITTNDFDIHHLGRAFSPYACAYALATWSKR